MPECPRCFSSMRPRLGGAGPHYRCVRRACRALLPDDGRLSRRLARRGIVATAGRYFDELPDEALGLPLVLQKDAPPAAPPPEGPAPTRPPVARQPGEVWSWVMKYLFAPLVVTLAGTLAAWLLGR